MCKCSGMMARVDMKIQLTIFIFSWCLIICTGRRDGSAVTLKDADFSSLGEPPREQLDQDLISPQKLFDQVKTLEIHAENEETIITKLTDERRKHQQGGLKENEENKQIQNENLSMEDKKGAANLEESRSTRLNINYNYYTKEDDTLNETKDLVPSVSEKSNNDNNKYFGTINNSKPDEESKENEDWGKPVSGSEISRLKRTDENRVLGTSRFSDGSSHTSFSSWLGAMTNRNKERRYYTSEPVYNFPNSGWPRFSVESLKHGNLACNNKKWPDVPIAQSLGTSSENNWPKDSLISLFNKLKINHIWPNNNLKEKSIVPNRVNDWSKPATDDVIIPNMSQNGQQLQNPVSEIDSAIVPHTSNKKWTSFAYHSSWPGEMTNRNKERRYYTPEPVYNSQDSGWPWFSAESLKHGNLARNIKKWPGVPIAQNLRTYLVNNWPNDSLVSLLNKLKLNHIYSSPNNSLKQKTIVPSTVNDWSKPSTDDVIITKMWSQNGQQPQNPVSEIYSGIVPRTNNKKWTNFAYHRVTTRPQILDDWQKEALNAYTSVITPPGNNKTENRNNSYTATAKSKSAESPESSHSDKMPTWPELEKSLGDLITEVPSPRSFESLHKEVQDQLKRMEVLLEKDRDDFNKRQILIQRKIHSSFFRSMGNSNTAIHQSVPLIGPIILLILNRGWCQGNNIIYFWF